MTADRQSIDNAAIREGSDRLRDAILAYLAGRTVEQPKRPAMLYRQDWNSR
jgi:hypothetical protein